MRIWLVEISDFLPVLDGNNRLFRCGMLAQAFVDSGHEVLWWSSTFNHQLRRQRFMQTTTIDIQNNYRLRLLYGPGYQRNISLGRFKHNLAVAKEFAKEITDTAMHAKPDLIYACLPTLEVAEKAVIYGNLNSIPVVVDIRDQWPDIYLSAFPKLLRPIVRVLLKTEFARANRILSKVQAISAVSESNLKWGLGVAQRNARVCDKWFPLGFAFTANKKEASKRALPDTVNNLLNTSKKLFLITFVGSFSPSFNFKTVLRAARIFTKMKEDRTRFVFVGEGKQSSYMRKQVKKQKNIILTGWCEKMQVEAILNVSSVGLAPYSSKITLTLPNKPFEYMASGIPILSSLTGELEAMIKRESIGLHYDADDFHDLYEKIQWFLMHPEKVHFFGQKAKALIKDKYNADKIYSLFVDHLCSIANKGKLGK
jgi:glycosyltransferase involved in cell wall biosynthesis